MQKNEQKWQKCLIITYFALKLCQRVHKLLIFTFLQVRESILKYLWPSEDFQVLHISLLDTIEDLKKN